MQMMLIMYGRLIVHMQFGGCHPRAISLLIVIELRNKDQSMGWDVLNPMVWCASLVI